MVGETGDVRRLIFWSERLPFFFNRSRVAIKRRSATPGSFGARIHGLKTHGYRQSSLRDWGSEFYGGQSGAGGFIFKKSFKSSMFLKIRASFDLD